MKEIDFLPEWYKSGRRRRVNYRMQYIILSSVFAVMMAWNCVATSFVSKVRAKNTEMEINRVQSEKVSAQLEVLKREMTVLQEKEKILDSMDSKIIVSNVLAEISYLVNEKVVLSRVDLISGTIPDKQSTRKNLQSSSAVRSSVSSFGNNNIPVGSVRFRILIAGVAANGSDVAVFLCKLEDSTYFSQVDLSYSRDALVKAVKGVPKNIEQDVVSEPSVIRKNNVKTPDNIQVNEFEISCYLSNYSQQE
jgi:hypothetical protein